MAGEKFKLKKGDVPLTGFFWRTISRIESMVGGERVVHVKRTVYGRPGIDGVQPVIGHRIRVRNEGPDVGD